MHEEIRSRVDKVLKKMEQEKIEVLLSYTFEYSSKNPRYLSGFSGSFAYVVISKDRQVICSDSRYWEQIKRESPLELVRYNRENADSILSELLGQYQRIGFESKTTTVHAFNDLKEKVGHDKQFVEADDLIKEIRMSKSEAEIEKIRKAEEIAIKSLQQLFKDIKPGKSERELAAILEFYMVRNGARKPAFDTIMGSGENGALPHAAPSDRKIQEGDFIVIDFGAEYEGYCSDITRTIAVGEPTEEMKKVYNTVLQAQIKAEKAANAGKTGQEVDSIARDMIKEAGYGEYFQHGLGHGLGLDVHEDPAVSQKNKDLLPVGAVVTIEPGIYIPGQFGVRIEDDIYIKEDSNEVLTNMEKEMIIIK